MNRLSPRARCGKVVAGKSKMKTCAFLMLGMLLALPLAGKAEAPDVVSFSGSVSYQTLERGFFAIDADDGQKFMPINLPKDFAVDGLRVQVTARARNDMVGIQMYGTLIEIVAISRLPEPERP